MAEPIFGEVDENGAIVKNTRVSALSGKRTEPGDPIIRVTGTNVFYRLEAQELKRLNDTERNPDIAAAMRRELESKPGYPTSAVLPAGPTEASDSDGPVSRRKARE